MCMRNGVVRGFAFGVGLFLAAVCSATDRFQFGTPATPQEISGWNIDVDPNGSGAPPGSGTVAQGERVYATSCASCHGNNGQGKPMDRLVGGQGTLASDHPVKTVGSYWPYATTVFDYIRRAMPFTAPRSLNDDQVYAVTAYLLYLNGIISKDAVLNAKTLPKVKMPNRNGFVSPDTRPDAYNVLCMQNCR